MEEEGESRRYTAVRYRLYPNATHRKALERLLALGRLAYNILLEECRADAIEDGYFLKSTYDISAMLPGLKKRHLELKDAYAGSLQNVAFRVHQAMTGCTWNDDGEPEHLPRLKSEHRFRTFVYPDPKTFGFVGDRLKLPKVGKVRYRNDHRPKGGVPKTCTVLRDSRGKWYAIIMYSIPDLKRNETDVLDDVENGSDGAVGYDLGLRNLVSDSEGHSVECPDFGRRTREEVKRLRRIMSENPEGSNPWEKARCRIAVIEEDNQRRKLAWFHLLARSMVVSKSIVVLERLEPQKMKDRDGNPAAVRDKYSRASWGLLYRLIELEAEKAGVRVVYVDPSYTSRTCSHCGHVKESLPLSYRTYRCECCGMVMDRDVNAAINIRMRGLGMEPCAGAKGRRCRLHGWTALRASAPTRWFNMTIIFESHATEWRRTDRKAHGHPIAKQCKPVHARQSTMYS